ncbi:MAG: anhydro-N-acetylmuramic acid kinase [Gammaproteobacteria bacterium]
MAGGQRSLYVGLMSGTSVDGVDAVLVRIESASGKIGLLASHGEAIPADMRARVIAVTLPGENEIDSLGPLDVELGKLFSRATLNLLGKAGIKPGEVAAIGSHGQTIRHRTAGKHAPFTLQIGDPNVIAETTGITTVADFRRRDVAAGGNGAPLVPAFHDAVFRSPDTDRAVVNIGGMANITILPATPGEPVRGFDTGPGNVLLDAWHERHRGSHIDHDGAWGRSGAINSGLLEALLSNPFLEQAPPKSTGREQFSIDALDVLLEQFGNASMSACDVQATLVEFTARSIADALLRWGPATGEMYLCGGGAHNGYLRERLAALLPRHRIQSTAALGIDPDWVEAMAFAWLAHRTLKGLSGNLPAVTGASHPVVLGGIYQGSLPAPDR